MNDTKPGFSTAQVINSPLLSIEETKNNNAASSTSFL